MIKLFDNYIITADEKDYILKDKDSTKEHRFPTLPDTLKGFEEIQLRKRISTMQEMTLKDAYKILKKIEQEIAELGL